MLKQKLINNIIPLLIILIGIICITYSLINISNYSTFNIKANTTSNKEKIEANTTSNKENIKANTTSNKEKIEINNKSLYIVYPSKGDYIGIISIPILNKIYPIYEGTSNDELKKGVGHFIESVLPGEQDNSVISGHRDTVFNEIGKLTLDDKVIITTEAGEFTYKVIGTRIVKKDDKTVIVPTKEAILTITTCYPFNYIGIAPDRYIIKLILVKSL